MQQYSTDVFICPFILSIISRCQVYEKLCIFQQFLFNRFLLLFLSIYCVCFVFFCHTFFYWLKTKKRKVALLKICWHPQPHILFTNQNYIIHIYMCCILMVKMALQMFTLNMAFYKISPNNWKEWTCIKRFVIIETGLIRVWLFRISFQPLDLFFIFILRLLCLVHNYSIYFVFRCHVYCPVRNEFFPTYPLGEINKSK